MGTNSTPVLRTWAQLLERGTRAQLTLEFQEIGSVNWEGGVWAELDIPPLDHEFRQWGEEI